MSSGAIQKSSGAGTKVTALSSGERTSGTQSLHCVKVSAHERYKFRRRNQGSRRNRIIPVMFRHREKAVLAPEPPKWQQFWLTKSSSSTGTLTDPNYYKQIIVIQSQGSVPFCSFLQTPSRGRQEKAAHTIGIRNRQLQDFLTMSFPLIFIVFSLFAMCN